MSATTMKTLLICHEGAALHREGIARWLASFSELAGVVVLREPPSAAWRRTRRELRRVGPIRFADVIAFRLYYRLFLAARDEAWKQRTLRKLCELSAVPDRTPVLYARSPNTPEAERFIKDRSPDVVVTFCKVLLKPQIWSIPRHGAFALHPGICPEYRNAHGCFWALARGDVERVGMTLLRIDAGIDTGPIYGYYRYPYDEVAESHIVIQHRVVLENLDALREKLVAICAGRATPIDTSGRTSATWGQPRLTSYFKWKYRARKGRVSEVHRAALS